MNGDLGAKKKRPACPVPTRKLVLSSQEFFDTVIYFRYPIVTLVNHLSNFECFIFSC